VCQLVPAVSRGFQLRGKLGVSAVTAATVHARTEGVGAEGQVVMRMMAVVMILNVELLTLHIYFSHDIYRWVWLLVSVYGILIAGCISDIFGLAAWSMASSAHSLSMSSKLMHLIYLLSSSIPQLIYHVKHPKQRSLSPILAVLPLNVIPILFAELSALRWFGVYGFISAIVLLVLSHNVSQESMEYI
jgi:hypothetical protein